MEGVPKSVESNYSLEGEVKSLENRIKKLKWHKRIAYALAITAGLGFAAEHIDNAADQNAKNLVRDKIERIKESVDLLEANDAMPDGVAGLVLDWSVSDVKSIEAVLDHSDRNIFEKMVYSAEVPEERR